MAAASHPTLASQFDDGQSDDLCPSAEASEVNGIGAPELDRDHPVGVIRWKPMKTMMALWVGHQE
jgi:hypothetical protein